MEKYVLESLFLMRSPDEALQRMKERYHDMVISSNITTLWEGWDLGFGSYNHAWSGGPLTLLSQYTVGIAPTSPGWRTYAVLPQEGRNITRMEATVPIIVDGRHDTIGVLIEKTSERAHQHLFYKLVLSSPNNTVATVGMPRVIGIRGSACPLHSVSINNSRCWATGKKQNITKRLEVDGLVFKGATDAYVMWQVTPGLWQIEGVADCSFAESDEKAVL